MSHLQAMVLLGPVLFDIIKKTSSSVGRTFFENFNLKETIKRYTKIKVTVTRGLDERFQNGINFDKI